MAIRTKLPLAIFLFFLLAFSANLALGSTEEPEEDPELQTCKHQCKQQQQYSKTDKKACMERCDKYHEKKKEQERRKEEGKGKEEENPFLFHDEDWETRVQTMDGKESVLQNFAGKSEHLRGLENFRLVILEAKGQTFIFPTHYNFDVLLFVVKGRATIGLVKQHGTERFNLEPGDIMRISAGITAYMVNREVNEKLFIAKLHMSVSIPGKFEAFHSAGGRNPESVLGTFSWDILEAAFQTKRGNLEKVLEEQDKGRIFKVSKEQVESLSKHVEGPSFWPLGWQPSRGPFNLFRRHPTFSNQCGRLLEIGPDDHNPELQHSNLMVSYAEINNGSMSAVLYNSKATKIALVIEGEGRFEMACPRSTGEIRSEGQYRRVSGMLKPGVVFVVPAGHPFVTVASCNGNLRIICFEVNAKGNMKYALAGKKNIVNAMDKEAKQLAFNLPAEEVDKMFSRDEEFYFAGPNKCEEREEGGRAFA